MNNRLNEAQIDDLLDYIDTYSQKYWKNGNKLICCPVHGESNPSMGVSVDKQVCHCFSCGFAGDFARLLQYSLPDEFGLDTSTKDTLKRTEFRSYLKAKRFLKDRYELEYHELGMRSRNVKRYDESRTKYSDVEKRPVLPRYKLAPFKSGKETYEYFFSRGFTKSEMQKYMVGRDVDNKTITIPVFYEDNTLAGIIGRYISTKRKKNQRYKIYNDFERSRLLYPLNISKPENGTVILVEGQLDVIRMHRAGYMNTFALMTNSLSKAQADWLCSNCRTVIWVCDNDSRSQDGQIKARKLLKNKVVFKTVEYPNHGKDCCDWTDEEIAEMLSTAHSIRIKHIARK